MVTLIVPVIVLGIIIAAVAAMGDSMLKNLYALFLGLLLAVFIGVGTATFYVAPKAPEYPESLMAPTPTAPDKAVDAQRSAAQIKYDADQKAFEKTFSHYNRNVSLITLAFAVLFLIVSLVLDGKIGILADGLLLGGIFTLIYAIIRGFMTDEMTYRFAVTSVGLLVALVLGYIKFAHQLGSEKGK